MLNWNLSFFRNRKSFFKTRSKVFSSSWLIVRPTFFFFGFHVCFSYFKIIPNFFLGIIIILLSLAYKMHCENNDVFMDIYQTCAMEMCFSLLNTWLCFIFFAQDAIFWVMFLFLWQMLHNCNKNQNSSSCTNYQLQKNRSESNKNISSSMHCFFNFPRNI